MKQICGIAAAFALTTSAAFAGVVTPSDVKFSDGAVSASLTGVVGSVDVGRKAFSNRKQGNCLACHVNSEMPNEFFQGEVGPTLDGVADRWSEAELRGIVANSKMMFDGTIMPGFYVVDGIERPLKKFEGKTVLTAQQVEDVVAYLLTLTE